MRTGAVNIRPGNRPRAGWCPVQRNGARSGRRLSAPGGAQQERQTTDKTKGPCKGRDRQTERTDYEVIQANRGPAHNQYYQYWGDDR